MKIVVLFLLYINIAHTAKPDNSPGSYGPYVVNKFSVKGCEKLMKPLGGIEVIFDVQKNSKGHHIVKSKMNVSKEIGPLMGKTRIYKWTDGKFVKTLTMNQANVCQYAFPLKALPFTFKIDKNCVTEVADYPQQTIDVEGLAQGLLGKKFFYGRFKFIFEWFSKKFTAICSEAEAEIIPIA